MTDSRSTSGSTVSALIHAAQRGQPEVRDCLLQSYRTYLELLARMWIDASLQEKADPADLVQETLLKAHCGFGGFRGRTEAELTAWLRQILTRSLADFVRRYRAAANRDVARERSLDELLGKSSRALGGLLAASGSTPSAAARRREMAVVLADALAELPTDYREVVVLRSLEEHDWGDVARMMGRSPGAVRMLWTRALQRLRPLIETRL